MISNRFVWLKPSCRVPGQTSTVMSVTPAAVAVDERVEESEPAAHGVHLPDGHVDQQVLAHTREPLRVRDLRAGEQRLAAGHVELCGEGAQVLGHRAQRQDWGGFLGSGVHASDVRDELGPAPLAQDRESRSPATEFACPRLPRAPPRSQRGERIRSVLCSCR